MTSTSRQVHARANFPLTIGIVGPSGTGKSTLAKKIARMITRSEHSPNVLLVDADIAGRGLTSQIEQSVEFDCRYLHDALSADQSTLSPVELPDSCIGAGEWPSLADDGRVFFLPSSAKGSERGSVPDIAVGDLRALLREAIKSAASSGRAEAVVIDTAPSPDATGAVFASMCDLIILIGDKERDEQAIKSHFGNLKQILGAHGSGIETIPGEFVFNHADDGESAAGQFPANSHVLPAVRLGDAVADSVDFERRVAGIVTPFFNREHPGLVPSWCAPLPGEWRKVALALGESRQDSRALPAIARPFLERIALALAIGIPAATCLFLSAWATNSALRYVGASIGVTFLAVALSHLIRVLVEWRACAEAAKRLAAKDLDWILERLSHEHEASSHSEKTRKMSGRKLSELHRVFDALARSIRESGTP